MHPACDLRRSGAGSRGSGAVHTLIVWRFTVAPWQTLAHVVYPETKKEHSALGARVRATPTAPTRRRADPDRPGADCVGSTPGDTERPHQGPTLAGSARVGPSAVTGRPHGTPHEWQGQHTRYICRVESACRGQTRGRTVGSTPRIGRAPLKHKCCGTGESQYAAMYALFPSSMLG